MSTVKYTEVSREIKFCVQLFLAMGFLLVGQAGNYPPGTFLAVYQLLQEAGKGHSTFRTPRVKVQSNYEQ